MDFKLRNHNSNHKSNSNRKNKRNTIDLVNVVYDEEFVSLINSISTTIKNYYNLTLNIIRDLYNNSISIDNNLIYSKCLINEINYNTKEKIKQLEEKVDSINNTKKIFEKNILLIHSDLNKFFNDSKQIFKNIKNIRNSKINFAIDSSKNFEKYGTNNSMINFKTPFEKNELLINPKENERYYKNNINNSLSSDKPLSSFEYKRNRLFRLKGNSTEINKRHKLKSIYFNNDLTNSGHKITKNDSFKIRNKLFEEIKNRRSHDNTIAYKPKHKNIQIGNMNHIFEFTPEISKNKSSYNNFYINQNSNINLNSNNINNINNNNLELSYKVIEFLSLLSNITKSNSKNNPNIHKMIQNFEKTKKNLFELSKKYIEQNNLNDSKIYSGKSSSNSTHENGKSNITKKELQLLLMNNNIENIKKGMEYKELIDKIKYLSENNNKLEKQNKQLSLMNNNTKKELINNTLLLSKKNNQLNIILKEKAQFISQINVLKKDNEALMELIQEKNKSISDKEPNKNENTNNKEINIIKQKDKIINDLKKKINEFDKKILEKNNETNNLNNKIKELNDSLTHYKNQIKEKQNLIQKLQLDNQNKNIIQQQNLKISLNYNDLIFEKIEELTFYANNKSLEKALNIEEIESFYILQKESKKKEVKSEIKIINNSKEIEELENKITVLNLSLESKENEIRKYKNENSILKTLAKNNKNNQEDENNHQELEEEINKLKSENEAILEEKKSLEENLKKLLSDNKNQEIQLDSKNSEIKNLENNIEDLEEQLKDLQMKNLQKIYNEQDSTNKIIEEEKDEEKETEKEKEKEKEIGSRNVKMSLLQADTDKNNEIINQLKEELKEKENEIEYLKIEIQELKAKFEDNEDNYMDSSLRNSELNDKYNTALEEKVKFLSERNEYYQKLYDEDKKKLQNLENINNNLKSENEELRKNSMYEKKEEKSDVKVDEKILEEDNDKKENKIYSLKNYNVICDKVYGELRWFLLVNKTDSAIKDNDKLNYDNFFWVPKINIIDIESYKELTKSDNENKKDDSNNQVSNKIYKSEIHLNKEKEISFSNNFSFNNNSEELNKNKQNSNNNSNSIKRGSFFSLGNANIINDENNNTDYNKLMEKYKSTLEKLNKAEEINAKLKKKIMELKEKIIKLNKNNSTQKVTISDDSNNFSNCNDIGKLSIIDNNFDGEGDIIGKLNNKNDREQEYIESMNIELEANKNQLIVVKQIFKELERKFETIKKICENLFSRITLKKTEKEEFKILLKVMDFTDDQIALIIDKRKK